MFGKLVEKAKAIFSGTQPEVNVNAQILNPQINHLVLAPFDPNRDYAAIIGELNAHKIDTRSYLESFTQKKNVAFVEPGDNVFDRLPPEAKLAILQYLTMKDLCRLAPVSKHWNYLLSLNELWGKLPKPSLMLSFTHRTDKENFREGYLENKQLFKLTNGLEQDLIAADRNLLVVRNLQIPQQPVPMPVVQDEYVAGGDEDQPETRFTIRRN